MLLDMDSQRPPYCKHCGAALPSEGRFCESCGASIESEAPGTPPSPGRPAISVPPEKLEDFPDLGVLPDPHVMPRIGRALSIGWDLLSDDFLGALLVALVYVLVIAVISSAIPVISSFITVALGVGLLGWAEERRRRLRTNVGTVFRIGTNRIGDALLLGLVLLGIGLVVAVPIAVAYFSAIVSLISSIFAVVFSGENRGLSPFFALPAGFFALIVIMVVWFGIIIGPILQSFTSMASWAIARGKPFSQAVGWAWDRIRTHFAAWWLAGLVINIITMIGMILCYIGIIITLPWGYLAWAEIIGDSGDDAGSAGSGRG